MSLRLDRVCFSFLFCLICQWSMVFSQVDLDLSRGEDVKNVIQFYISSQELTTLKKARGEKLEFKKAKVKTEDGKKLVEKLRIRGQSSLSFDRKSFNVNLFFPHVFSWGNETKALKEFYLISLSMDENYYRSALSYHLLAQLGLFTPFIAFTEVRINQESQGIYLVVEKPHENKMEVFHSPFVLRRGYHHEISDIKFDKNNSSWKKADYLKAYDRLYELPNEFQGDSLYREWNRILDMESYFTWLAFNYFMMNGDYSDELYLFALPESKEIRFGILPWDYDDILTGQPHKKEDYGFHEGWNHAFMFMAEEDMDRVIGTDTFLQQKYLENVQKLLSKITPEMLKSSFEKIYHELYPYYKKPEIIQMSKYDLRGETNLKKFEEDFEAAFRYFVARHNWLEKLIGENR